MRQREERGSKVEGEGKSGRREERKLMRKQGSEVRMRN